MAVLGGILGAIVGFAVGILFTEVIFASNRSWPDVVPFVLAVIGFLVGREIVRHYWHRNHGASATPSEHLPH